MVEVCVQTLIVANGPGPGILVLCPTDELETGRSVRVVPIWVGMAESQAMSVALRGQKFARPLTHDLLLNALTILDCFVDRVEITRVEGKTFFSTLVLRAGDRILSLDARPSDAVALAVRQGAPIYMSDDVLASASYPFVFRSPQRDAAEMAEFHNFVQSLSPADFTEDDPDQTEG